MLAAMLMVLMPVTHAGPPSHTDVSVDIVTGGGKEPEDALWLAYLMTRAAYINEHEAAYGWKPGTIVPSFEEELAARTSVVKTYKELQAKDPQLRVAYFEELALVADRSFLGEYVWTYLHQAGWGAPPRMLHLVDFMHWRGEHLAKHLGLTRGSVRFSAKGQASAAADEPVGTEMSTLVQGQKAVERGELELAIAAFFDPVIEHYARLYRDPSRRVYAARNQTQVIIYTALPNPQKKPVDVLDGTWSDAYLMKAYVLTELRRVGDAQAALEQAIELSPLSAQYISELAFTYQAQGDCARSIESYKQAESVVELGSDDSTKVADLTRALRGQGYCLVELGKLDEAEALYHRCLKVDPGDTKARGELEYIKKKRTR
jgi:tetratricopeptide (TPR) repeat protein